MACTETHSCLRIFSEALSPDDITQTIGLTPSQSREKNPDAKYKHHKTHSRWLLCTRNLVDSTDNEDHLSHLLDLVSPKSELLEKLQHQGCDIDISNFWVGDGQGGPYLSAELINRLSRLNLAVWWDNYFESET